MHLLLLPDCLCLFGACLDAGTPSQPGGGNDDKVDICSYFEPGSENAIEHGCAITPTKVGTDAGLTMAILVGVAAGAGIAGGLVVSQSGNAAGAAAGGATGGGGAAAAGGAGGVSGGATGAGAGAGSGSSSAGVGGAGSGGANPLQLVFYCQFIVTVGLISGNQPDFFRSFASQFAWLFPLGSSSGLHSIATGIRSGTGRASDAADTISNINPAGIALTGVGRLANQLGIPGENVFICYWFLMLFLCTAGVGFGYLVYLWLPGLIKTCGCNRRGACRRVVKMGKNQTRLGWNLQSLGVGVYRWLFFSLSFVTLYQLSLAGDLWYDEDGMEYGMLLPHSALFWYSLNPLFCSALSVCRRAGYLCLSRRSPSYSPSSPSNSICTGKFVTRSWVVHT